MRNVRVFSCLAVLALAVSALASTLASRYDSLETALNNALSALSEGPLTKDQKKQKAALTEALKFMAKDSTTLDTDVNLAQKVLHPLKVAGFFDTATDVETHCETLSQNIQGPVFSRLDTLDQAISGLPDGKAKTKATALSTKARDIASAASDSGDPYSVVHGLAKALPPLESAEKIVSKAST